MSASRFLCGIQPVREAIRAHGPALKVMVASDRDAPQLDAVARYAKDRGSAVERVDRGTLDRMARGVAHQGVAALAPELVLRPIESLEVGADALVVATDELQDPQNFGAVIRSAVALGAGAVLWSEDKSAPLSPATVRASAGAIEHATLCRARSLPTALSELRARGLLVVGLDAQAEVAVDAVDLTGPLVLVVGSEGKGLRRPVKQACDRLVKLPMEGPIASLNASVAAAIALYEVQRQRRAKRGAA